jgi:hypothetical protein
VSSKHLRRKRIFLMSAKAVIIPQRESGHTKYSLADFESRCVGSYGVDCACCVVCCCEHMLQSASSGTSESERLTAENRGVGHWDGDDPFRQLPVAWVQRNCMVLFAV